MCCIVPIYLCNSCRQRLLECCSFPPPFPMIFVLSLLLFPHTFMVHRPLRRTTVKCAWSSPGESCWTTFRGWPRSTVRACCARPRPSKPSPTSSARRLTGARPTSTRSSCGRNRHKKPWKQFSFKCPGTVCRMWFIWSLCIVVVT